MKRLLKMSSAPRTILSRIPASPISKSTKPTHSMDMLSMDHPTFTITAHGIFARMPIIKHSGFVVAVMNWSRGGQRLGLLLSPSPRSADSTYPSFNIGDIGPFGRDSPCWTIPLGDTKSNMFVLFGKAVAPQWKEVYLAHRPPPGAASAPAPPLPITLGFSAPFRIPQRHIDDFLRDPPLNNHLRLVSISSPPLPWNGTPPVVLSFDGDKISFQVILGRCTAWPPSDTSSDGYDDVGPHWARITFGQWAPESMGQSDHTCDVDHIGEWPNWVKTFIGTMKEKWSPVNFPVRMSFTPCPLNPGETLIVHLAVPATDFHLRSLG